MLPHQDLKSPNILVDERWRVKITDFGLSRVRMESVVTASGQGGTPEWMAPEVLRCEQVTEAADVYSYGVVLWELLTGQPPWENYNPMQVRQECWGIVPVCVKFQLCSSWGESEHAVMHWTIVQLPSAMPSGVMRVQECTCYACKTICADCQASRSSCCP